MGSIFRATCPCGYERSVVVGAGRDDFQTNSKFPFYCKRCALVDVNICTDSLICPECSDSDLVQYGTAPISPDGSQSFYMQWRQYRAGRNGHLCPSCRGLNLSFDRYMMFD